jgi:hypothetical protein
LINLDGSWPLSAAIVGEAFSDASSPDERGMIFQVPFDCDIDLLSMMIQFGANNTSAGELRLYADPLGTPTVIAGPIATVWEEHNSPASARRRLYPLAAPVSLTKNTDYCLALKSIGTGNVSLLSFSPAVATYAAMMPGGTAAKRGQRNNLTGAFTIPNDAVLIGNSVRVCAVHDS